MTDSGHWRGSRAAAEFDPAAILPVLAQGPPANTYLVGFSGGLDSCVLLESMARLRRIKPDLRVRAAHIDHGLHADSSAWTEHCRRYCEKLELGFTALQVKVAGVAGQSPEDAAREARYQALASVLGGDEVLLLAQHRDDQVETLLYRLVRGAGSRGLAGMPTWRRFAGAWLGRPLLHWPRSALHDWAQSQGLDWLEDPSNDDLRYDRNFLRRQLLPLLRQRFPGSAATLVRAAANLRDDADLLTELAQADLRTIGTDDRLDLIALKALSRLRQTNLLRHWLGQRQDYVPGREQLQRILDLFLYARADAQPQMVLAQGELRRYRTHLYWARSFTADIAWPLTWDGVAPIRLPGTGRELTVDELRRDGVVWPAAAELQFRPPQPGLRLRLAGAAHTRRLKKLMQEAAVPPWMRARLAVLHADGEPIWIERFGALDPVLALSKKK